MTPGRNPPEFYGAAYLQRPSHGVGGRSRWEDNGVFLNAAVTAHALIEAHGLEPRVLHVGCGRGYVVRHLRNLGVEAHGLEYSPEAVRLSVAGAAHGDLFGRLPVADGAYPLSLCLSVLSHLPAADIPHALAELFRVTAPGGRLWTTILVGRYSPQQPHHKVFEWPSWWTEQFRSAGWALVDTGDFFPGCGYTCKRQWPALWSKPTENYERTPRV